MNPLGAGATPNSREAYRQQYMNSLTLEIANQTKNLNANKLFKANGSTGSEPADTRSVTEKYADIDGLKREVRSGLREITDGNEAEHILADITTAELQFLAGQLPHIIADLKPKWRLGVPVGSFLPYFRKLMRKNIETEGVDYGVQQGAGEAGGGITTTAVNLITQGDIDDDMDEMGSMRNRAGIGRSRAHKLQQTEAQLRRLRELVPTPEDRVLVASLGDAVFLADYDDEINQVSQSIPSQAIIADAMRQVPVERSIDMVSSILDGVDWEGLETIKEAIREIQVGLRIQENPNAPSSNPNAPSNSMAMGGVPPTFNNYGEDAENSELTPLGRVTTREPVQELLQSERDSTDLPDAYVNRPIAPERLKPYEPLSFEISVDDFADLPYNAKMGMLMMYADQGKFHDMPPDFLHMINAILEGIDVPERDMVRGYSKFVGLTKLGSLNKPEFLHDRPQDLGMEDFNFGADAMNPEFQEESGLGWAKEEESPIVNPNQQHFSTPYESFAAAPLEERIAFIYEKLRHGDFDGADFDEIKRMAEVLANKHERGEPINEDFVSHLYEDYLRILSGEAPQGSFAGKTNYPSPHKQPAATGKRAPPPIPTSRPPSDINLNIPEAAAIGQRPPTDLTLAPSGASPRGVASLNPTPLRDTPPYVSEADFADLSQQEQNLILSRAFDEGYFEKAPDDIKRLIDKNIPLIKRQGYVGKVLAMRFYKDILPALEGREMIGHGLFKHGKKGLKMGLHLEKPPTIEKGSLPKKKKNIMFGMGLSVVPTPKAKVTSKNIDLSKGIEAEPAYVPFGTHLLNKHRLKDNIVMMRTKKGGAIVNIPTQKISSKLAKVLHVISGGSIPQFESVMDLEAGDKALLHQIAKTSKVSDRISVPNPDKSKMEEEDNRFNILRGEIALNNDNPAVIKEFKVLLLKFMREGRVPTGQGKAIMEEMLLMGY